MIAESCRNNPCSCFGTCCMLKPSSSVVSSPNRYQTPIQSEAGTSEAARACKAPGPMEVTTAAFSPVTHRKAVAACEASISLRTPQTFTCLLYTSDAADEEDSV